MTPSTLRRIDADDGLKVQRMTARHSDSPTSTSPTAERPGLAMVVGASVRPYRAHLHGRIAAEIDEFALHSLFLHRLRGFEWAVAPPPEINPVVFDELPGDYVPGRARDWLSEWRRGGRVIEYLQQHNIRAVIVNGYGNAALRRVIAYCHRSQLPVFLRSDSNIKGDTTRSGPRLWLKRQVLGRIVRRCTGFMPMGRFGQAYFQKYGADPAQCFRVPYEPDYESYVRVDAMDLERFRRDRGLSADRKYLIYSGRLVAVKRLDLLIAAFVQLADQRAGWDLLIAGEGPLGESLVRRVPTPLKERVHWLGLCDADQMRLAYHAADVLVLPSDDEPWGLVVNEAMASGLVVVASDVVGSAHEMVEDHVSGRLFNAGDLTGLTESLRDVTDPAQLPRYQAAVAPALERWRDRADPVEGVRAALRSVGLLPDRSGDAKT